MKDLSKNHREVLVVIVGDYEVTGVVTYLEERLPRLSAECGACITLFCPGRIVEQERAKALASKGIKIVEGHVDLSSPIARRRDLRRELHNLMDIGQYDVVHVNTASRLVNYIALSEAQRHGVELRIAHSHNANTTLSWMSALIARFYYWPRIDYAATDMLACSNAAGEFLCGEKEWRARGKIAVNGVDTTRYRFDAESRSRVRSSNSIEESKRVVGFIGRMSEQKNPLFMVEIAKELHRLDENTIVWMVGDGPLLQDCENLAQQLEIGRCIRFFGSRNDVVDILQGLDVLVMTSFFEGLAIVALEAQASGLGCVISEGAAKDAVIPGCNVRVVSLEESPATWAREILSMPTERDEKAYEKVANAGFDIEAGVEALKPYYS